MSRILVVGYDGGLGREVCRELNKVGEVVKFDANVQVRRDVEQFLEFQDPFDFVIYCAGINMISKFDDVEDSDFFDSMMVNCYGFARVVKMLRAKGQLNPYSTACIVTSNAANIPMSHSLSYNCSKAAANMMVRQMAREIRVEELTVFAVAPNKLEGTGMSRDIEQKVCAMRGWTPEQAAEYQLAALPARKETDPRDCALFIRQMLSINHVSTLHGTILPYGGPQL